MAMAARAGKSCRRFLGDQRGNISLIAGLSLPVLVLAVGGGIDLSRAFGLRQELANVSELSCSQSSREITYLRSQPANARRSNSYFLSTANTVSARRLSASGTSGEIRNSISGSTLTVTGTGSSDNVFAAVMGANTTPVSVTRSCQIADPGAGSPGTLLFMESFETGHSVASNNWGVLQNWNGWMTFNAGIEINGLPELSAGTIRFGNFFAELDSHCFVSGCQSNSTMSRILRLTRGDYEIRYWYISRVRNPNPAFAGAIGCGAGAALEPYRAWQNETNRIDVYAEREGDYTFAASNIVDSCVYADQWVERRIPFRASRDANYRFSWRASGQQDTVGGLIDYIRICRGTCP
ncbi:TadE/TadG family type IV pilus assembly protein [Brevundimonas aveniformis]|uniref:TadE/TadG family type IV pilus assembly protein n=1 Tax=Brevundimonas aveniformis TaxID=370977 RepID=UPI0024933DA5|nr:TadE/TadG family type IV pilus assembly protein [Brevundimonas aveniformis]